MDIAIWMAAERCLLASTQAVSGPKGLMAPCIHLTSSSQGCTSSGAHLPSTCVVDHIVGIRCCHEFLLYCIGEVQAGREIAAGELKADSFRFFAGLMEWESSRLLQDIQRGLWYGPVSGMSSGDLRACASSHMLGAYNVGVSSWNNKDKNTFIATPADACRLPQVHSRLLKISSNQAVSAAPSAPVEGGADTHGGLLCSSCAAQVHVKIGAMYT